MELKTNTIKTTNTYSYYEPHIIDKLSNQLILSNHIPFDYFESSNILRWSEARKRLKKNFLEYISLICNIVK